MSEFVSEVAARVRPLLPADSLARATEAVRTAPGGPAPVQEGGVIIGLVGAAGLADWIAEASPAVLVGFVSQKVKGSDRSPNPASDRIRSDHATHL